VGEGRFHSAWIRGEGPVRTQGQAEALFPWWSFTKTVLAVAALKLVEDGRLELDEPRPGRPFTLRQLLTHRAGVTSYGRTPAYHQAVARGEDAWSRERLLQEAGADELEFEPGQGWGYSNIGYLYVRAAIETAAGAPLAAALRTLVLDPLGLARVRLAESRADFQDQFWPHLKTYDPGWVYHGCLIGPAAEAARLLQALFDGELLAPATVLAMYERYTPLGDAPAGRPGTEAGYGMGLMLARMGAAGRVLGHSGAGPGAVNTVGHFIDLDPPVTVAVFTDGEDEGAPEREAVRIALEAADG
jgi:CubicO group peptidase (beta-lactamase class C family)